MSARGEKRVQRGYALKADVEEAFAPIQGEPTITIYHGGVLRGGVVQGDDFFSTTPSQAHAEQYAAEKTGGEVYEFRVPKRWLSERLGKGVEEGIDLKRGTSDPAQEYRFSPSLAPELNNFRVQRGK